MKKVSWLVVLAGAAVGGHWLCGSGARILQKR